MSERKVLNKYYPPEFDPSKIPKLHLARNRQFSIRIMAPFNMRCDTCGEYIYKGKKFNSRKETVENEDYLGLHIHRFYIKCPRCVAEIAFKTDPQNTDYALEAGATRNFEALRKAEILAEKELAEKEELEKNNPMKVLENRTKASRQEMDMLETLEDLRELNSRHAKMDHESMLKLHKAYEEQLQKLMVEEEEDIINSMFGKTVEGDMVVKRLHDDDEDDSGSGPSTKIQKINRPTDLLHEASESGSGLQPKKNASLVTKPKKKNALSGLVKKKQPDRPKAANPQDKEDKISNEQSSAEKTVAVPVNNQGPRLLPANKDSATSIKATGVTVVPATAISKPTPSSALGLLGGYSDSSENSSDND